MQDLKQFIVFVIINILLCIVIYILRVQIIKAYHKWHNIEVPKGFFDSYFMFSDFFLIPYLIKEHKNISINDTNTNVKYKKTTIYLSIFYVLCIVTLISTLIVATSSLFGNNKEYYDMYHNEYSKKYDVVYYDRDNNKYILSKDKYYLMDLNTNEITNFYNVDDEGYVVTDSPIYATNSFISTNELRSECYFNCDYVYWDKDGKMYYEDYKYSFEISQDTEKTFSLVGYNYQEE